MKTRELELLESLVHVLKADLSACPVPVSPRAPPCCTGCRLAPRSLCLPEGNPGASSMCWPPHPPMEGGPAPGLTPLWTREGRGMVGWDRGERECVNSIDLRRQTHTDTHSTCPQDNNFRHPTWVLPYRHTSLFWCLLT